MSYSYSSEDKKNSNWFINDNSRGTLASVSLTKGKIRGLHPFRIDFEYPISAIAGVNGSGKSTILAIASCAFHNRPRGFTPPLRKQTYYTFRDFFIQSANETPIEGVEIRFGIRHNKWRSGKSGVRHQVRQKRSGGRWNDYRTRVKRNVIYFGVQRVVPHFERSVHKSYHSLFSPGSLPLETRKKIADIAGRIIGKTYTDFDNYEHSKYSLPQVETAGISYSGFNMGSGESAVFEIFTAIFLAGPGTLVVVDEIELGLHEEAQHRLIDEFKKLCLDLKCQIICSTHSHAILNRLPPEGRFFIEEVNSKTSINKGISADFACGKMGRPDAHELDIFVEDAVAKSILQILLPVDLRKRSRITPIGSHGSVLRQLTSRYLEGKGNCLCILDGDQENAVKNRKKHVIEYSEASTDVKKSEVSDWAEKRISFLPGSTWPEKWLLESAINWLQSGSPDVPTDIVCSWGLPSKHELLGFLEKANNSDKHNEFFELAKLVDLDKERVRDDIIKFVLKIEESKTQVLIDKVKEMLP